MEELIFRNNVYQLSGVDVATMTKHRWLNKNGEHYIHFWELKNGNVYYSQRVNGVEYTMCEIMCSIYDLNINQVVTL